ncbi:bifunctional helix-turn-helix transcriptional regulator/GNAT family N-acetyltransferase [Nocardia brasiliensis]|uniref:bifunctional helix-turn-helix transcriptional regulator/GNAT family N-acetyltransferase n=1 Tax=Nocardia brasiliensis TaxID=37326 RepID=UPI00245392B5|nr:bifunctional helix-turn-helix transcriptional regulator/GNAT family N-acetyltransferase [Nocardia brasiliensis]
MTSVAATDIAAVREFNRRYTRVIGVLREGLLDSEYSLTEVRILFELANSGITEVVTLRQTLDLDAGYLSRILTRFEREGLVLRNRSDSDGRRQEVRLTAKGKEIFAVLDQRSSDEIGYLLNAKPPATRARLVTAMRTIQQILDHPANAAAAPPFTLRPPAPGDFGWVIERHARLYTDEYGWDGTYEELIVRIVADYLHAHDEQRERAWIAESGGAPVGSIFCVAENETTARLRLLLVEPTARGLGVGSALVEECLRFATAAGYRDIVLWTNDVLTAARHIYQRAGFELVEQSPHHSWGADLIGQTWRRSLGPAR